MPYFDYECRTCGKPFEIYCGLKDDRSGVACAHCGGREVQRVYSSIYLPKKTGTDSGGPALETSGSSKCSSCASRSCSTCG